METLYSDSSPLFSEQDFKWGGSAAREIAQMDTNFYFSVSLISGYQALVGTYPIFFRNIS